MLTIFSTKVNYHKNGLWWFTKVIARIVGEKNFTQIRYSTIFFNATGERAWNNLIDMGFLKIIFVGLVGFGKGVGTRFEGIFTGKGR